MVTRANSARRRQFSICSALTAVLPLTALQRALALRLDPVAQRLFEDAQRACRRGQTLTRLDQPNRLLLELQCVLLPRRLRHIRYPFALEQLAKSDVLQGQGQSATEQRLRHLATVLGLMP